MKDLGKSCILALVAKTSPTVNKPIFFFTKYTINCSTKGLQTNMLTNVIPHQHHYKIFLKKILITFFVLCLKVNTFICITNSKNFTFGPLYFLKVTFIYMDIQIIRRTKTKKKGKKMIWLYKLTLLRLIQHNRGASLHCLIIIHLHIMKN